MPIKSLAVCTGEMHAEIIAEKPRVGADIVLAVHLNRRNHKKN